MRCDSDVEHVCAGTSEPLAGVWMYASTRAASAVPVEQTCASGKIGQKVCETTCMLSVRCSPRKTTFAEAVNQIFNETGGAMCVVHTVHIALLATF